MLLQKQYDYMDSAKWGAELLPLIVVRAVLCAGKPLRDYADTHRLHHVFFDIHAVEKGMASFILDGGVQASVRAHGVSTRRATQSIPQQPRRLQLGAKAYDGLKTYVWVSQRVA